MIKKRVRTSTKLKNWIQIGLRMQDLKMTCGCKLSRTIFQKTKWLIWSSFNAIKAAYFQVAYVDQEH
jgi:hypothetical protein